ncbi:MAG: DUF4091 domain-containing protein [Candidatus Hydrogenedentes bacterium]|nr:DUF4091 domain-containing protein [Candidatus Hydrogenedentota bacterium]
MDGIGHWTHSTTQADPWLANADKNDEYALVYPGETPVPSVRWEAVRDGLEDVAAIRLLEEAIERAMQRGGAEAAVTEAEAVLQAARIDILEIIDDAFIESRDYLKAGDRRVEHTWWDAQVFEEHRARIARATLAL